MRPGLRKCRQTPVPPGTPVIKILPVVVLALALAGSACRTSFAARAEVSGSHSPIIEAEADTFLEELTLRIRPGAGGHKVRFTLDGSEPVMESPELADTLVVTRTTLVRARAFAGGEPTGPEARRRLVRAYLRPGAALDSLGETVAGLQGTLYRGSWDALPVLDRIEPVERWNQKHFGLAPHVRQEGSALRLRGWLLVREDGIYRFLLEAQAGAQLFLDGRGVSAAEASGGRAEDTHVAQCDVALGAGAHPV